MNRLHRSSMLPRHGRRQQGVVMLFCLIVLVVLLAGGVAVMRSMNSSLFSAGNLAFKRDLVNQGEQAIAHVLSQTQGSGALANATSLDLKTANYKAERLTTNAQGIPNVLLADDSAFGAVGLVDNDIVAGPAKDVKIRYVIDRQCEASGVAATTATCIQSLSAPSGGTAHAAGAGAASVETETVYRLSVRVSGARNTQVFLQASFTKPN